MHIKWTVAYEYDGHFKPTIIHFSCFITKIIKGLIVSARALDKYVEKNCRKLKFSGKFPQCPLYVTPQSPQKSPWCFFRKSTMAAKNINYWPLSHFWPI